MKNLFKNNKKIIIFLLIIFAFLIKDYIPFINEFVRIVDMKMPREGHKTLLLNDGRVLIIGGTINSGGNSTTSAEIYDPTRNKFMLVDNLKDELNEGYATTLLSDGKVLVSGGVRHTNIGGRDHPEVLSTLQIYNPKTNKFSIIGEMKVPRRYHTATLLPDGQVLIIGGGSIKFIHHAELFNPKTNKTREIGNTIYSYYRPSAILTKDGVFITASFNPLTKDITRDAELYDINKGKFISVGNLNYKRVSPNLLLLKNGDVLISGGIWGDKGKHSIEIYHNKTKKIEKLEGLSIRDSASIIQLKNGTILETGGNGPGLDISYYKTAKIIDIDLKTKRTIGDMKKVRSGHSCTLLPNGKVLITGGWDGNRVLKSSEIFNYRP